MTCSSFPSCITLPPPIAGRQVWGEIYADRCITIPFPHMQVLYAFTGTALTLNLIDSPFVQARSLRSSHLYVRTSKGVFFVYARSLAELVERLGVSHFMMLHHCLAVNVRLEMELDLDGKRKTIGIVATNEGAEWLVVSRRAATELRKLLGFRRQPTRSKNSMLSVFTQETTSNSTTDTES